MFARGDDNYGVVPLGFSFPFFGTTYTQAYLGTNAFFVFQSPSGCCPCYSCTLPAFNGISIFNIDLYTGGSGQYGSLYYGTITNSNYPWKMSEVQSDVNTYIDSSFVPSSVFVLYWDLTVDWATKVHFKSILCVFKCSFVQL